MNSDTLLEKIRHRAYQLWQEEGCPEGREHDHWVQAQKEIQAENNADPALVRETEPDTPTIEKKKRVRSGPAPKPRTASLDKPEKSSEME